MEQYSRANILTSTVPAVYYAHLASNRARHHEDVPASKGIQSGPGVKQGTKPKEMKPKSKDSKKTDDEGTLEYKPLLKIVDNPACRLPYQMWYI